MIQSKTVDELISILNESDEHTDLEAKSQKCDKARTVLETVCSFSNEPDLGGGTILLGVAENTSGPGTRFFTDDIADIDHTLTDLATQCKTAFNQPVYPKIDIVQVGPHHVLKIDVKELPAARKPLYFKDKGLPHGAYRRVGGSDLVCTSEDIAELFDTTATSYDATPINATIDEVDPNAIRAYRDLRAKVNPEADELGYSDAELLTALNCTVDGHPEQLNVGGALLFGTSKLLRRVLPMARVDYIRVPTIEWVEDPDDTYDTVDMRGPLILLVNRLVNTVNDDLLRTFSFDSPDAVHSKSTGLPIKVIREAVVNALMHASYKVGSPTQIVRYPNRIEIRNAGYSLKSLDQYGAPGSIARNKVIAPVFHETNTAETKGGGMRRMKKQMLDAHFAQPTYESNREANTFVLRLLLHHFLGEFDLGWLKRFAAFDLSDSQRMALVFVREVRAVDNQTYRQLAGCDTLKASQELRKLRDYGLLRQKGSGVSTYYVSSWDDLVPNDPSLVPNDPSLVPNDPNLVPNDRSLVSKDVTVADLRVRYADILARVSKRMSPEDLESVVCDLCQDEYLTKETIAELVGKGVQHIKKVLRKLVLEKRLVHRFPMVNHPEQAYCRCRE